MDHRSQLYLISPPAIDDVDEFAKDFRLALGGGGVACFQLRLKNAQGVRATHEHILRIAGALLPIAREHDVAFLINDDPALAASAGADGVHIGQSDTGYEDARDLLGADASIGVTCHNSKHLALEAGEKGADYVAFGAFFPTQTKATEYEASPALIEWWVNATTVPCVAIGGIAPENCAPLVRAGADFLAVSSAVWRREGGPGEAVKAFHDAIGAA